MEKVEKPLMDKKLIEKIIRAIPQEKFKEITKLNENKDMNNLKDDKSSKIDKEFIINLNDMYKKIKNENEETENRGIDNNLFFLNKKYNEYIGKKRSLIDENKKKKESNIINNKIKDEKFSNILNYLDNNNPVNESEINKSFIDNISKNISIIIKLLSYLQSYIKDKKEEESIQLKESESPEKSKIISNKKGMHRRIIDAKEKKKLMCIHNLGLGLHFHKDKNGKVYKYSKNTFLGRDICIFNCCDKDCHSNANYIMSDGKFIINSEHDKKYEEHSYIMKPDKDHKIMEEFKKKNFIEGQVFQKDAGPKIVQWYD